MTNAAPIAVVTNELLVNTIAINPRSLVNTQQGQRSWIDGQVTNAYL